MPLAYRLKKEKMYVIMKKDKTINIISILILTILIFNILINNKIIINIFNIRKNYQILIMLISLLSSIVIIYIFKNILNNINKTQQLILIITYVILILICLYYRKPFEYPKSEKIDYIIKWIKIIFKNKIVFINIIGNICLFIPLGIILCDYTNKIYILLIISILIITTLEILQYITKRGIFDYIDIILNYIGVILGITLKKVKIRKEVKI